MVEATVEVETQFWVSLRNSSAFISTRQEGEEWVTHDFRVDLEPHAAFEEAFGVTLVRFYTDFEEWGEWQRTIMLATAYKSCEEYGLFHREEDLTCVVVGAGEQ